MIDLPSKGSTSNHTSFDPIWGFKMLWIVAKIQDKDSKTGLALFFLELTTIKYRNNIVKFI